jgi:hypothetical protein
MIHSQRKQMQFIVLTNLEITHLPPKSRIAHDVLEFWMDLVMTSITAINLFMHRRVLP